MNPSPYRAPFTSAHTRAFMVKLILIVGAIVDVLMVASEALSLAVSPLAEDQDVSENPMAFALAMLILLLAMLAILTYVLTIVFFCVWLYRAYDNLPAFGHSSRNLSYSPGWAVGSFFIPFVNLVVPYRAVKELWQRSIPLEDAILSEPSPPASFPIWWTFWLLSSFAGNLSMRLSFNEDVPESTSTLVSIAAGVLSIIAAGFAYMVVHSIDKRQEETSRKLGLGNFPGPPPAPVDMTMPYQGTPQ